MHSREPRPRVDVMLRAALHLIEANEPPDASHLGRKLVELVMGSGMSAASVSCVEFAILNAGVSSARRADLLESFRRHLTL